MRRFKENQIWTSERYIALDHTMAKAAENMYNNKGLFYDWHVAKQYNPLNSPVTFWDAFITSDQMNRRAPKFGKNKNDKDKLEDYRKMQKQLLKYLGAGSEYKGLWMKPIDTESLKSQEEITDLTEKLNILSNPTVFQNDTPQKVTLKEKAGKINYHDVIEFANIMDLSNATAILIDNKDVVQRKISAAMVMIERSYRQSRQNSNISGLLYTELRNMSKNMNDLNHLENTDDVLKKRFEIAASLDKLDLLATKYLDHKIDDFKENAYDKIRAAAMIKNIVGFCYGVKPVMEATDNLNVGTYMAAYKEQKQKQDSELSKHKVVNQQAAKTDKNVFEKNEQTINGTKVSVIFDHTLKNAIESKQADQAKNAAGQAAGPQA